MFQKSRASEIDARNLHTFSQCLELPISKSEVVSWIQGSATTDLPEEKVLRSTNSEKRKVVEASRERIR